VSPDLIGAVWPAERLVLDVDQVLLDTRPSFYVAARLAAEEVGGTLTEDELATFKAAGGFNDDWHMARAAAAIGRWRRRTGREDPLHSLLRDGEGLSGVLAWADDPGDLTARCRDLYAALAAHEVVWVDVDLLRAIQAEGVALSLCTGRNREQAQDALARLGIEVVAARTMEDGLKPDPAVLLPLLDGARAAWFCGDSVDDQRCAAAARPRTAARLGFCRVLEPLPGAVPAPVTGADAVSVGVDPFLRRFLEVIRG
jgi:phosphoglycolate phosphatase-like HAD superfamily hydrolase